MSTADCDPPADLAVLELLVSDGGRLLTTDEARAELGRGIGFQIDVPATSPADSAVAPGSSPGAPGMSP